MIIINYVKWLTDVAQSSMFININTLYLPPLQSLWRVTAGVF